MSDDLTMLGPDGIQRSYDEHYDTVMDVEQDPTGAFFAIQKQAYHIEELEAKLGRYNDLVADKINLRSENADLKAKLAKAVKSLEAIEDASRFFARDRESSDTETLSYAHETTRRLCATTLAELSSVSCANLKGDNQ